MTEVLVVGAGLAGCEAALRLATYGYRVALMEMRPEKMTPAHRTGDPAELVCSNSLKSEDISTASGLLKKELGMVGCSLLELAAGARVPAGHALAVDREVFSRLVASEISRNESIRFVSGEQKDLDVPLPCIIATGPLTSDRMSRSILEIFGKGVLHFYDAISLSVSLESLDTSRMFKASRYGRGGDDYWNVPLDESEYARLVDFLRKAPRSERHDFEDGRCFEACLPVEVAADRGDDVLRFGPLRPRGLPDPVTGTEPYAVIQLRQESLSGSMLGLVGFQTRMTRPGQREMLGLIPGFSGAEVLRYGSIHRNSFLESPALLDGGQMAVAAPGVFFAGQMTGVEGYVESIAHGLIVAMNVRAHLEGGAYPLFPEETVLGGLQRHLTDRSRPFQPMNSNFGLLPPVRGKRSRRKTLKAERSLDSLSSFMAGS